MQEEQGGTLLKSGKQVKGHRVIGFERGGKLIVQPGLHLYQIVLITGQFSPFVDEWAVRFKAAQVGQVAATSLCQQLGINLIGFSACRSTLTVYRLGIGRVNYQTSIEQSRDEQTLVSFDDTGQWFTIRNKP